MIAAIFGFHGITADESTLSREARSAISTMAALTQDEEDEEDNSLESGEANGDDYIGSGSSFTTSSHYDKYG